MAILGYKTRRHFDDLPGWLDIATDNLEDSARQRIAIEIESHFAAAVTAHVEVGQTELSAQATALAELGSPQKAALNFRQNHLTQSEAKWIMRSDELAAKPFFWSLLQPLDYTPLVALGFLASSLHWALQALVGLTLIAYTGLRLIPRLLFLRSLSRESFRRSVALSFLITSGALVVLWQQVQMLHLPIATIFRPLFFTPLSYFLFYILARSIRIWIKVRKTHIVANDLKPSAS